ncbi:SMP-30/gluconolactonase/LRE family protein [Buttiauxella sp. 3AFRM03]|uniref:SMP-30/gluconolactonase/LRE family protein n=1 Tax=Buttiauxella sp. 3AFRM03 TaxID=2479367 RepID=UPI000EF7CB19|nr:SMP-30/gluconolactonase/LRE family protein [Buttiauxella sp. 3AFRM03]AYN28884.1 SMP-30/gluconolactonase/LRE family protein [Buttiauxella sp. 3AFRM03]
MNQGIGGNIEAIGEYRAQLGETPVWCRRSGSLLWVDILQNRLLRYWPNQAGSVDVRPMPVFTSAVLLTSEPEIFLVVSQSGISLYNYQNQQSSAVCAWPNDAHGTRPNEAAIAPDGSLWFSTMDPTAQKAIGSWYRVCADSPTPQHLLGGLLVPNTLQWIGENVWFADSLRHHFYRATLQPHGLHIEQEYQVNGIPDGSTLTDDGELINACWGSSCLARYRIDNLQLVESGRITLPVSQPSSCTFGGPNLSDLYITSARDGLARPVALDGAVLKITTTIAGTPARKFRI